MINAANNCYPYEGVSSSQQNPLATRVSGLMESIASNLTDGDEPLLTTVVARTKISSRLNGKELLTSSMEPFVQGVGIGLNWEDAIVPALAETMERYATATFYDDQFIWARADSLIGRALDLDTIPICSKTEMASPYCSLNRPSKTESIRWVHGVSLHDGEPILVPVVMVYSHAGWRGPHERFWLPISTGCAAHTTYKDAVLSGVCEVVERDAISLVWLQRLTLPHIVIDEPGPAAAPYWNLYRQSSADIDYHFFNATTDIGLPTVYGIQISRYHPYARTLVACATALTFDKAIAKIIKDFVAFKRAFVVNRSLPHETAAFTGLLDGATYMARPEQAHAFDFLLQSSRYLSLRDLSSEERPLQTLPQILQHLSSLKMQAIAVDLTTDEALRAGLHIVRVLIPELQPLSLHTAVQYLAHPRLYSAPSRMGYIVNDEAHLNQWPQPFA
jgi:ribosomal protein S12 methylthiotransferase accessory factor